MKRKFFALVLGGVLFASGFTITNYAYDFGGCGTECSATDNNGCMFDKCNYVYSGGKRFVACYYKPCKNNDAPVTEGEY